MSYGVTSSGFNRKPLSQILSDMETMELQGISASLDVQATALVGVLNGIMGGAIDELWGLGLALYSGMDPDAAADDQLTSLSLLTGAKREAASDTVVVGCTVNVNTGFSQAPGTMFAYPVGNPSALFTNKTTVANSSGVPANETVDFVAVTPGPTPVNSSSLTVIATPISGWNSITNPTAGVTGQPIESDSALRARREAELSAAGTTSAAAIQGAVLKTLQTPTTSVNTLACTVLWNDTDATDANGLPPHSIEVIAYQPGATSADDQALVDLILSNKAAGIGTNGTSSKTSTDSQGTTETINYTRPAATTVNVTITVFTDPRVFPSNGATLIQNAITAFANSTWQPGVSVYAEHVKAQAFTVPGVLDVTAFTPSNTAIDVRHVAVIGTIGVTVT